MTYFLPRKYVAPICMVPKGSPRWLRNLIIDTNLRANDLLPESVLRRLDARHWAKAYWTKIQAQEERIRCRERINRRRSS